MAIENGPLEDVFPIEHGDFPASYVSLPEGTLTSWGRLGGSLSRGAVVHAGLRAVQFAVGAGFWWGKKCGTR